METRGPKFEWLALFLLLPLMAILGYLEVKLQLSPTGHMLVQFGILFFIGFLANSWISANELAMRRSQYTHKPPEPARREDCQSIRQADSEKQAEKQTTLFSRLAAWLRPLIRHN